jgi:ubiquitin carboxyl-terminal hydrolase 7
VTKEESRAAVEEQYGGDDEPPLGSTGAHGPFNAAPGGGFRVSKLSNAYMLVYVRVSQWDDVMCRVTKDDIPTYLRERLEVRHLVGAGGSPLAVAVLSGAQWGWPGCCTP